MIDWGATLIHLATDVVVFPLQRFIQYLASSNSTFNLSNFLDKGGVQGEQSRDPRNELKCCLSLWLVLIDGARLIRTAFVECVFRWGPCPGSNEEQERVSPEHVLCKITNWYCLTTFFVIHHRLLQDNNLTNVIVLFLCYPNQTKPTLLNSQ